MADTLLNILVVDDDETICELLAEGLPMEGYHCETAPNAEKARGLLRDHQFDIALLDINLPDQSGIDLIKEIHGSARKTEVIIVTAIWDVDTAVQAMKLGASDYIIKPITISRITNLIRKILEKRKEAGEMPVVIPTAGAFDRNVAGWEINALNTLADGIEAQVDYFDSHSKIVTEKTVLAAGQLGLPANYIKQWAEARHKLYRTRNQRVMLELQNPRGKRLLKEDSPDTPPETVTAPR